MTMTAVEREQVRTQLHLLKPKSADALKPDFSNLDAVVAEYDKLYKIGRQLVIIEGRTLAEGDRKSVV